MSRYDEHIKNADKQIFRTDLISENSNLGWLRDEDIISRLKYLNRWDIVPNENNRNTSPFFTNLKDAREGAENYLSTVASFKQASEANNRKNDLMRFLQKLRDNCDSLRGCEHVLLAYELKSDLQQCGSLLEIVEKLNVGMGGLQSSLTKTIIEHSEKFNKLLDTATDTLSKASQDAIAAKEAAEKAAENVKAVTAKTGMTYFAKAFNDEADAATNSGSLAFWIAIIGFLVGIGVVGLLIALTEGPGASPGQIAQWVTLRLAGGALIAFFIGYFLRERRYFQHVAVSNRHRRNLCNAYLAIADVRSEQERAEYLKGIMPHVAPLGKTGFLGRDELPGIEAVRAGVQAVKAAKDGG